MEAQTTYQKSIYFKLKAIDESQRIISGVFSTPAEDRHGEIVDQKGWDLKEYLLNPVILFGHDHSRPAIGRALELSISDAGLEGRIQFAETPFAQEIFSLYKGGYMSAFSCGFRNDLYEYNTETDEVVLRENTLFEISCVNVPANAYALAKSKGLELKEVANPLGKIQEIAKTTTEVITEEKSEEVTKEEVAEAKEEVKEIVSKALETTETKGRNKQDIAISLVNQAFKALLKKKSGIKNKKTI